MIVYLFFDIMLLINLYLYMISENSLLGLAKPKTQQNNKNQVSLPDTKFRSVYLHCHLPSMKMAPIEMSAFFFVHA